MCIFYYESWFRKYIFIIPDNSIIQARVYYRTYIFIQVFGCHRNFAWPITELDYVQLINLNIQAKRNVVTIEPC